MVKPITIDMLKAMSLDQRKTLQKNALGRDTPAAREVLELLSQDDLLGAPPARARKAPAARSTTSKVRAKAAPKSAPKAIKAVYGRQA